MDKNEHNSNMKDKFKFTKKDILRAVAIALVLTTVFFAGFFTHYFTLNKELRSIEFLIDVYKKNFPEAIGRTITHFYNVSWEGTMPTWTHGLEKFFKKDIL